MKIVKAVSIDNVSRAFIGQPLDLEDLDLYLDTEKARGGVPFRKRMIRLLQDINDLPWKILFVGYKGCGKSTELTKLKQDIIDKGNNYLVLNYSVFSELDPENVNYIELFIVTMEKLFDTIVENGLTVRKEYLEKIKLWDTSTEITQIKEKYLGRDFEAGADLSVTYFQKLFAKLKSTAKISRSFKEVLKTEIEPRLPDLIENCNLLITEIRLQLHKINKDNMLIIIEDIDKISVDSQKDLFVNHAGQITQLDMNMIFTFPISLYYSSYYNSHIKTYFMDSSYELPMIKVREKDGQESSVGIETLQKIVGKRMDLTLFEDQEILKNMILMSGGCLRDLFLLIREAANFAMDEDRMLINQGDYNRALQNLIKDYENNLTDETIEGHYFPIEKLYEELVKLATQNIHENTLLMLKLRQTLCVLGYNGEGWCAVHPVVKEILKRKNLIEN